MEKKTLPVPVVLWVKNKESYVSNIQSVVLRVKQAARFGENLRGLSDGPGSLVDLDWDGIMKLKPTELEFNNSACPVSDFIEALDNAGQEQVNLFFERLQFLSLNMVLMEAVHFISLLKSLNMVQGFSFIDTSFSEKEWKQIAAEFRRLNLRCLSLSDNVLDSLLIGTDVQFLQLSGSPGLSTSALEKSKNVFVTVTDLVTQSLDFKDDKDAERFLDLLPVKFPRVKSLLWDWNMVDPAVVLDERATSILNVLVDIYKKLNMTSLAIVCYTPCINTKHASGEVCRILNEKLPGCNLYRFLSRGVSNESDPNFSLITVGSDLHRNDLLHQIIVLNRNPSPSLRDLAPITCGQPVVKETNRMVADFGGFNCDLIRKQFSEKKWNEVNFD